ncbi:hypothetical protein CCR75_004013 [Bremia lactucae]|uniref:Uncharacterized protein n=1 Tax=Bremia lactucae TaxID=4779 RepID=A0A976IAX5_BRELC|nr:hypothetical protein CCR75_004013 [Bremia lactucae]
MGWPPFSSMLISWIRFTMARNSEAFQPYLFPMGWSQAVLRQEFEKWKEFLRKPRHTLTQHL